MNSTMKNDVKKQQALQRLGTDSPQCILCGETDYRCLERHHPAGRAYDEQTVIYCRNCHRKQSDPAENAVAPTDPPLMERVGHFLIGLAELFLALAERFRQYGAALLDGAPCCPGPWGCLPEVQ